MTTRTLLKELLGGLPYTAEMYWLLRNRNRRAFSRFNLDYLHAHLPGMVAEVEPLAASAPPGRDVFLFASLHFWISHALVTGLALRGLGHRVTLGYLPHGDFAREVSRFDLRRNDVYARNALHPAERLMPIVPLLGVEPAGALPEALAAAVNQITTFDTRYILQREEVSGEEPVFKLRQERNLEAARRALAYLQQHRPQVVLIPNGMIQEFGAVYETARFLGIPLVTYEFGEQDQRIWVGQDRWVMHHRFDELWESCRERPLTPPQKAWLEDFLAARQKLITGPAFAHLWQKADRAGAEAVRRSLGLDQRPIVLLPTNVLGDSATLGQEVFSRSMTDWLEKVLPVLAARSGVQVVIRIHPAETLTVGPSVKEVIHRVLPDLPAHIRLIEAQEKVNSYDLMDIADLALVYTTTAGLEMALRGIPVLVSGRAHYTRKGFTLEADTWEAYLELLERALAAMPARLSPGQVELARRYIHAFFGVYPLPFPWHLEKLWSSLRERPLGEVLSPAGRQKYLPAFQALAGLPIDWVQIQKETSYKE